MMFSKNVRKKIPKYYGYHSIIWLLMGVVMPIKLRRKIINNHGSLQVTIPKPICKELGLEKTMN
ncbi:MAG: hypothetical protein GF308_14655 [Candidatus Heimdallarchaeota archaeon]|nr:hypothetical protein [Candidatus Heimdallarchaeota archaeon]